MKKNDKVYTTMPVKPGTPPKNKPGIKPAPRPKPMPARPGKKK